MKKKTTRVKNMRLLEKLVAPLGFTLTEVTISIGLVSMAMVSYMTITEQGLRIQGRGEKSQALAEQNRQLSTLVGALNVNNVGLATCPFPHPYNRFIKGQGCRVSFDADYSGVIDQVADAAALAADATVTADVAGIDQLGKIAMKWTFSKQNPSVQTPQILMPVFFGAQIAQMLQGNAPTDTATHGTAAIAGPARCDRCHKDELVDTIVTELAAEVPALIFDLDFATADPRMLASPVPGPIASQRIIDIQDLTTVRARRIATKSLINSPLGRVLLRQNNPLPDLNGDVVTSSGVNIFHQLDFYSREQRYAMSFFTQVQKTSAAPENYCAVTPTPPCGTGEIYVVGSCKTKCAGVSAPQYTWAGKAGWAVTPSTGCTDFEALWSCLTQSSSTGVIVPVNGAYGGNGVNYMYVAQGVWHVIHDPSPLAAMRNLGGGAPTPHTNENSAQSGFCKDAAVNAETGSDQCSDYYCRDSTAPALGAKRCILACHMACISPRIVFPPPCWKCAPPPSRVDGCTLSPTAANLRIGCQPRGQSTEFEETNYFYSVTSTEEVLDKFGAQVPGSTRTITTSGVYR